MHVYTYIWASLVAQMVKNPPAKQETWGQSLGQEDPLEKGIAPHSCLENSMDRGTWKATVHGVTKSQRKLSNVHFHTPTHIFLTSFH